MWLWFKQPWRPRGQLQTAKNTGRLCWTNWHECREECDVNNTVCSDTYMHANVLLNKYTWTEIRECLHTYVRPTYIQKCKTTHMYANTCEHTKQAYKHKLTHNHARIHLHKALSSDIIVHVFDAILLYFCSLNCQNKSPRKIKRFSRGTSFEGCLALARAYQLARFDDLKIPHFKFTRWGRL